MGGGLWEDGAKSFATDQGKPSFALKTAHQEKTYAMFRAHDKEIELDGRWISLAHALLFVVLCCGAAVYANVIVGLVCYKNAVSVAEEEAYTELLGTSNISNTIEGLKQLSLLSFDLEEQAKYSLPVFMPSYQKHAVASLYNINTSIIMGLEHIRSYDQEIQESMGCLYSTDPVRKTNCPLAGVASHLQSVNPALKERLLDSLLKIKLPLSEAIDRSLLDRYPKQWDKVTAPAIFIRDLAMESSFTKIVELSQAYVSALEEIVTELRSIIIWPPLVIVSAVFGALAFVALMVFAIFVGVKSREGRKFSPLEDGSCSALKELIRAVFFAAQKESWRQAPFVKTPSLAPAKEFARKWTNSLTTSWHTSST